MPVAGRVEIAAHLPERELEIVERAGLAFDHDAAVEDAAAMLQAALERDLVGLDDLHCFPPSPAPVPGAARRTADNFFPTEYLGGSLLAAPRGRSMLPKFSALAVVALTLAAPAIAPPARAQPHPAAASTSPPAWWRTGWRTCGATRLWWRTGPAPAATSAPRQSPGPSPTA